MSIRYLGLGISVVALAAGPASAATYTGLLQGVITSGAAHYEPDTILDPDAVPSVTNLVGKPLTIRFSADVKDNYVDPYGIFYAKYVINTVEVILPAASVIGFGDTGTTSTNDFLQTYTLTTDADFSGNAISGNLYSISTFNQYEPSSSQTLSFSYSGASAAGGALTGSGTSRTGYWYRFPNAYYDISFDLLNGKVTAAPEPATWMLSILAFGAVGCAMRRNRGGNKAPLAPA